MDYNSLVIVPLQSLVKREHDMIRQSKCFVAALFCLATSLCAAQSATHVGEVVNGVGRAASPLFYSRWMYDQDYINNLAKDPNPTMQAAKKAVVQFEADSGLAVGGGHLNEQIDAILERYMVADYVQHDPNIPQGRKGLAEWFKAGGMHEGSGITSPPAPIALTADPNSGLVTMILEMEPQAAANDPTKKYPGYMISVFRVKNGKLTEHYGQAMRGTYYCRIDCGPAAGAKH
jgi:predicted SnoaL-like aldol condensation-catalyzing enzyme